MSGYSDSRTEGLSQFWFSCWMCGFYSLSFSALITSLPPGQLVVLPLIVNERLLLRISHTPGWNNRENTFVFGLYSKLTKLSYFLNSLPQFAVTWKKGKHIQDSFQKGKEVPANSPH